jgi:hypothetical protein
MLVSGVDGDEPVGARHLELEVGVARDGHELHIAWHVPWNPTTSKVRVSFLKLDRSPKVIGRSICPRDRACFPGDTMERCSAWAELGLANSLGIKSLGIHDVEAATPVH